MIGLFDIFKKTIWCSEEIIFEEMNEKKIK